MTQAATRRYAMALDPNKQLAPPAQRPATLTISGDEWSQGDQFPLGCAPVPPGTFPPITLTLLDDFPTFVRYEATPPPSWGGVQLIGSTGGFWQLSASYNLDPLGNITGSWQGEPFDTHFMPSGTYFFDSTCTQPHTLTV
jgi:hypothetical protein